MGRNVKILVLAVIITMLVGWGKHIFPVRLEVSNIQLVEVIGLDSGENKDVSVSLLFEPHKGEDDKEGPKEKIFTVSSDSFIGAEKGVQNYEDKIFIGSHVKDIVIGELMAKNELVRAIDFVGKNNEFRLDSKVYIAKESAASELFNQGINNNYILSSRIDNLSLSDRGEREVRSVEVVDIIKMLLSDKKVGVIPCVQIVKTGDKQLADYVINTSEEESNRLEFAGYGVFKDGKLTGYLGDIETKGYEFIKNLISEESITVTDGEDTVGISLTSSNSKIKFDFSGDTLNKVIIKIDTLNSILETSSGKNVFAEDIKTVEHLEDNYIKDVVNTTVKYAQNVNIDFLEIGETLEFKHPYKWRKIKESWDEMFSTIPIEVQVNSDIREQYGVLSTTGRS